MVMETKMRTTESATGKLVLAIAYVAGMVDMVALPVWVGALMQHYQFSPTQAGLTVTLFLGGIVLASLTMAPFFNRVPRRWVATAGYALGSAVFLFASIQPVGPEQPVLVACLHFMAGLAVGTGLSLTDGVIGRSLNPHRTWAIVNISLGVFAVIFMATTPQLIARAGASNLFLVFGLLMAAGALAVGLAFPEPADHSSHQARVLAKRSPIPATAWFIIATVACLTLNQALVFSFVERVGAFRGFTADQVTAVLIALGLVNLTPGILAVLLQNKWNPVVVGMGGPVMQAILAVCLTSTSELGVFAVSASCYVFVVIFTHTFLFGLLARLDSSGRAVAATPAMMMIGSCVGPILGGALVQGAGYAALGWAACAVSTVAVCLMAQVYRRDAE